MSWFDGGSTQDARTPPRIAIGVYAILAGMLFFVLQTARFVHPEVSESAMRETFFGLFEWGFVWADTLVAGPFLLFGGVLMFGRHARLGELLAFAGFAINLYAIVFFFVGLDAVGRPVSGFELYFNLSFTFFATVAMVSIARSVLRGSPDHRQAARNNHNGSNR